MEALLSQDLQRVASELSGLLIIVRGEEDGESITIKHLTVQQDDAIYDTVAKGWVCEPHHIQQVLLGDQAVLIGETFAEHGVQDGARLSATIRFKATVEEFITDVIALNPHFRGRSRELMDDVTVSPDDASRITGSLYWYGKGVKVLPDSIGSLTIDGNLILSQCSLVSLPERIGWLTVGGALNLGNNRLTSLPESVGSISVGGTLYLNNNQLASLPESFGSISVGGDLNLNNNQLTSLPESIGTLTVGGALNLSGNPLG